MSWITTLTCLWFLSVSDFWASTYMPQCKQDTTATLHVLHSHGRVMWHDVIPTRPRNQHVPRLYFACVIVWSVCRLKTSLPQSEIPTWSSRWPLGSGCITLACMRETERLWRSCLSTVRSRYAPARTDFYPSISHMNTAVWLIYILFTGMYGAGYIYPIYLITWMLYYSHEF